MVSAGFEVIAQEQTQVRPSLLTQMNELHLLSVMDVPIGLSQAVDTFRETHLGNLVEEYSRGVSTIDGFVCVLGRKPMA